MEVERTNDILRHRRNDKESRYYSSLQFKCVFPSDETICEMFNLTGQPDVRDIEVSFAYSLPYTYSDLLKDIDSARKFLTTQGGKLTRVKSIVEG